MWYLFVIMAFAALAQQPCPDSIFSALSKKAPDSLTEGEAILLEHLKKDCGKQNASSVAVAPKAGVASQTCNPPCRIGYVCVDGKCVSQCTPPCRVGYTCQDGKCIELCNPPCPPGTKCANYDCVEYAKSLQKEAAEISPQHSHAAGCILGTLFMVASAAAIVAGLVLPTNGDPNVTTANVSAIVAGTVGLSIFIPVSIVSYVRESRYLDWVASQERSRE